MGKFREYLLSEGMGLADIGPRLDHMFNSPDFTRLVAGAFASTDVTGSEQPDMGASVGHPLHLASTDLTIPSVTKSGRIVQLELKKNPILIQLSDGTQANFTYDEYQRIDGVPKLGKTMTIIFQRHPEDMSREHSKIDKAIVTD